MLLAALPFGTYVQRAQGRTSLCRGVTQDRGASVWDVACETEEQKHGQKSTQCLQTIIFGVTEEPAKSRLKQVLERFHFQFPELHAAALRSLPFAAEPKVLFAPACLWLNFDLLLLRGCVTCTKLPDGSVLLHNGTFGTGRAFGRPEISEAFMCASTVTGEGERKRFRSGVCRSAERVCVAAAKTTQPQHLFMKHSDTNTQRCAPTRRH